MQKTNSFLTKKLYKEIAKRSTFYTYNLLRETMSKFIRLTTNEK